MNITVQNKHISLLLRVGLALSFLYPPIAAFSNPDAWVGYLPVFLTDVFPNDIVLLHLFGVVELVIALWLLWGKHIIYPAYGALFILLAIVILNWSQFDVLFRDLSIAVAAIALIVLERQKPEK